MKKEKLFKKWNRYYNINTYSTVALCVFIVIGLYMWACDFFKIEIVAAILFLLTVVSLIVLCVFQGKSVKLSNNKNNLNSFLKIVVDRYKGTYFYTRSGKRKLNKQMTYVLDLKKILENCNTDNDDRKKLLDFINYGYYLKNEDEFIQLCNNCLNKSDKQNVEVNEETVDKSNSFKLIRRFVLWNFKKVLFYTLIAALILAVIIGFYERIYDELPKVIINCLNEHKDNIETANTIMFDIAAILLLYFEIKQEDI